MIIGRRGMYILYVRLKGIKAANFVENMNCCGQVSKCQKMVCTFERDHTSKHGWEFTDVTEENQL